MSDSAPSANFQSLRELVALVLKDADRYVKNRLLGVLALVVFASVLTALAPVLLKFAVDGYRPVLMIVLYVVALSIAGRAIDLRGLIYARAERRMFRNFSSRVFSQVIRLPLRFHLDSSTGAISKMLDNGLQGYQIILHHLVFTLLPVVTELGTTVVLLAKFSSPVFLLFFVGALACYAVAFAYGAITLGGLAKSASDAQVEATATMTDAILNYELVKSLTGERQVETQLLEALRGTEREWVRFFSRFAYNSLRVGIVHALFLLSSGVYAAFELRAGRMTIGTLVLVVTYMLQVVRPVEMLGTAVQGFSQSLAMLGKVLALFREPPESEAGSKMLTPDNPGALEFSNVSVSFGHQRPILRGVSFKVPAGGRVGIVGASGAGKSTIVRVLLRLLEPEAGGVVLIDGVPISEISLPCLRQSVAVVPQDTILLDGTIAYNIAFGSSGSTHENVVAAAKLAHLHDWIMTLPNQYESRVGERGVKVSGGERQRIALARAALRKACILVCDEATASLDSKTEREVLRNLRELSHSTTTLMIAHRLSTVMDMDEILVIDGGVVAERGTHASLLEKSGLYARLWLAQQSPASWSHLVVSETAQP